MQNENKKGFQVRDLIVTALLSVCALVIYILCAFLSFSPYTMLVVSPLWALLAAITYFLVAAKTKKPWALFIFCAVTGIYGFYPPMIICCIIAGIISALIAWKTGCTNGKTLTISYIIYMVLAAFSGTYIPFLFFSKQTLEQYAGMFGESYLGILQTLVSPITASRKDFMLYDGKRWIDDIEGLAARADAKLLSDALLQYGSISIEESIPKTSTQKALTAEELPQLGE